MFANIQNYFQFFIAHLPQLLQKIVEQIYLVGLALLLAILIGIPLGIWAIKKIKLKNWILSTANILQTIPSLALLAFLIPFVGIGVLPAIITLGIYALLPIVRSTVTGIEIISPDNQEAAKALGFTAKQKLWMVELPLAWPTIISGIRIAAAMSVGIATLAAFIGAGGLGDFIFQGISLSDNRLVLLGAIPAALLALLLDYLIGQIELVISQRKMISKQSINRKKIAIITVIGFLLLALSLFPLFNILFATRQNSIRIATKNFTEQFILGYLMADIIEAKTNLHVIKKFNLGSTDICHRAMLKNEIDMYPEYTGTAYLLVLKQTQSINDPKQLFNFVRDQYLKQFNIVWLAPFGFNDTQAIAVREDLANQYHLQTISDLARISNQLTIAVPAEFMQRPDAFPGLQKTYNINFAKVHQMDPGLMYDAVKNHDVDVILAFSTDARIIRYHLKVLQDDKHLFPSYLAAPIIRQDMLQKYPQIGSALAPLAGIIDDQTMQQLNYQVDVAHQSPDQVAKTFLLQKKLL